MIKKSQLSQMGAFSFYGASRHVSIGPCYFTQLLWRKNVSLRSLLVPSMSEILMTVSFSRSRIFLSLNQSGPEFTFHMSALIYADSCPGLACFNE